MIEPFPEPQLQALLHTNHRPGDDELKLIHAIRKSNLDSVADCEKEVLRLTGLIKAVKENRAYHVQNAARYAALKSPVRYLPTDVLSIILSNCLPTSVYHNTIPTLLELSRVCYVWRSAVLNSPSLWTRFVVDCHQIADEHSKNRLLELVRYWASMAGDLSMEISLNTSSRNSSNALLMIQTITQYSERLSGLHLKLQDYQELQHFVDFMYPHLTIFDVALSRSGDKYPMLSMPIPSLWARSGQLTILKLRNIIDINDWVPVFEQLTNLRCGAFILNNGDWHKPTPPRFSVQRYPNLISFKLGVNHKDDLSMLEALQFPNLEHFYLSCRSHKFQICDLPQFDPSKIRSLSLINVSDPNIHHILVKFLGKFTLLEELTLEVDLLPGTLIERLGYLPPNLVSRLHSLTISLSISDDIYQLTARKFLTLARRCRGKGLKSLIAYSWPSEPAHNFRIFVEHNGKILTSGELLDSNYPHDFNFEVKAGVSASPSKRRFRAGLVGDVVCGGAVTSAWGVAAAASWD